MTEQEKHDYIFVEIPAGLTVSRWDWVERCLLGDIRTLLDGVRHYIRHGGRSDDGYPRGGANFSLPIVIGTAIDILSDVLAGETYYTEGTGTSSSEAVRAGRFISKYFPGLSGELARLLWDGMRNGLTHDFKPKRFRYRGEYIGFRFSIEERPDSCVERDGDTLSIVVNVFELAEALTQAVSRYKSDLKASGALQDNFIAVARAIEHQKRDITDSRPYAREAEALRSRLETADRVPLFE
jgi:hypothetical protein